MTKFNHCTESRICRLIATIDDYADAGVDPAFDGDLDELERQFAELRLTLDHI